MNEKTNLIQLPIDNGQTAFSSADAFEAAQRMAKALCSSSLVPKHYQGDANIANALIALEMAQRIGASPLMTMQNLYQVHGTPAWSAKFKIATFNQCGRFTAIRYEWRGDDENSPNYGCRAYATEKKTGETVYGPWITWKLVKAENWDSKNGSKWLTMPEKMFQYRAASWLVDTHAPEISMGLPTVEETHDFFDVDPSTGEIIEPEPETSRTSTVAEKIKAQVPESEPPITAESIHQLIETADNSDVLDECEDLAGELDKYSTSYKSVMEAINEKREALQ